MSAPSFDGSSPRRILIVSEAAEEKGEADLPQLLMELGPENFRWISWTVMDAFMKPLPGDLDAAILDLGMLTPLYGELLEKLCGEAGLGVLVHLTDNRPDTIRWLGEHPGVRHLRKPASLHQVMEILESMLKPG